MRIWVDIDPFFVIGGERARWVMIRHNPIGNFFGWISYTLSSAERYAVPGIAKRTPIIMKEWRPFEFDQTHILVALAGYDLPRTGASPDGSAVMEIYTPFENGVLDIDGDAYFRARAAV